ncbi:MAG: hypothetical protein M1833_001271 [Piccolia ochrophora]|nr:MAG: hypothetical protein M1833_001271 [Piccolia ochrophora]
MSQSLTILRPASTNSRDPRHRNPSPSAGSSRKAPWILGGIGGYTLAIYGAYVFKSYQRAAERSQELHIPADVSNRYDHQADTFDADVAVTEWLMGLNFLRQKLARLAYGDVLEVSVGTGRNLDYYQMKSCSGFVLVDKSHEMIEKAKARFKELHPQYTRVSFLTQDASSPIVPPSSGGFDTIVQTMGLCSAADPALLLRNLGTLANQEHGQILLLEHGRSHFLWLNNILDSLANSHADRYGCWWNRDISRIVEESGLEVVTVKRYHLGTTWWIQLRPRKMELP